MAHRMPRYLLAALLLVALAAVARSHSGSGRLVRVEHDGGRSLQHVRALGLHYHPRRNGTLEAFVSDDELAQLQRMNVNLREVPNLDRLYAQELTKRAHGKRGDFGEYHDHDAMRAQLEETAARCPDIMRLSTLALGSQQPGRTVGGREIFVMRISDNPDHPTKEVGEPEVKYVGNMHGDEVIGREVLIRFIAWLCDRWQAVPADQRVRSFIENTDLYIIPSMNPDGYMRGMRENARGFDLNRNFPDQFEWPVFDASNAPADPQPEVRQSEVRMLMQWLGQHHFVLSANMHGGSVVANYPYDGNRARISGQYTPTPDDAVFRELALSYARHNPDMRRSTEFTNGVTNGAEWYVLYGGMQDYNYLWNGCFEITLELSERKWPDARDLQAFWDQNRESLLSYLERVHQMGVRGRVLEDGTDTPVSDARVFLHATPVPVRVHPKTGDYQRLLMEGTYTLRATAPGFQDCLHQITVPRLQTKVLNVDLLMKRVAA